MVRRQLSWCDSDDRVMSRIVASLCSCIQDGCGISVPLSLSMPQETETTEGKIGSNRRGAIVLSLSLKEQTDG